MMMERTQIYLTREEREALKSIAEAWGQSQSEVIRVAIDRLVDDYREKTRLDYLRPSNPLARSQPFIWRRGSVWSWR